MPTLTDDQLDANVLYFLKKHRGKANPIGRWELVAKIYGPEAALPEDDSNRADREIRESVKRLRRAGVLICDMGDGRGRFLADNKAEYDAFRTYFGAAAFEKMETLRAMDDAVVCEFPDEQQPRLL